MARRRRPLPVEPVEVTVESLAQDGRGVAHVDGKAVFIDGALPGEVVRFQLSARKRKYDEGRVIDVLAPSVDRVDPLCPHFGECGGCSLQHMAPGAQILSKQQVLLDALTHVGRVSAAGILPPLTGPVWGYRSRARLSVRHVIKKGRVLVGFREKRSRYVADITRCEVLHPCVGGRIRELARLIDSLDGRDHIAQVEVAVGNGDCVLVMRNLEALSADDTGRLRQYQQDNDVRVFLQPGGPDTAAPIDGGNPLLTYSLPDYAIELQFSPCDFVQINADINQKMLASAFSLLEPAAGDHVLELFCGLGNFTLPLARLAGQVTAVEGHAGLVARAGDNARRNGIGNVEYHVADLTQSLPDTGWATRAYDKLLIDPPRTGALELVQQIGRWNPQRIVYVSCNPATLARDAEVLVHEQGYELTRTGVMDMFPHTTHVESIALFTKS